jgi:hypothetical protein
LNTYDKMKHYKSVSNYFNNNCAKNWINKYYLKIYF